MASISLKKLVLNKEVFSIIHGFISTTSTSVGIQDLDGKLLMGESTPNVSTQYPVAVSGEVIGWVVGDAQAQPLVALLSYLATSELEKKMLARETLDKYKEIALLYNVSEKITASLKLEAVAALVLDEAKKRIRATTGSVILLDQETQQFETIAAFGEGYISHLSLEQGQGIVSSVLLSGVGEIVNDVPADARFVSGAHQLRSLICAPLKTKSQVIGGITLGSIEAVNYTAADLKLFNALASQAASAIENALLHANKLKEERVKSNLERYVASQVVQAILESKGDISLEPVRKNLVVLFSDIRNFTTQCEELPPEKIVNYLNEYFTHMVEVIFSHEGTVNKFVGDMIVALFGAPSKLMDSETKAISAAIAMQKRIKAIPTAWIRENFNTGIGISCGEVIVGNIGSPQHMDYTAIGDEVNIASRLQSIAKGGQILVSRGIYDATKHLFDFKICGDLTVKGKRKTVEVFEVLY